MKSNFLKSKGANTQTFYNFLSTMLRSGIMFITMPIFTRILGTEQYGLYSIYASWLTIFVCFMGMNVKSGLGTGLYKFKDDYPKFRSSTLVEGSLISAVIIIVAVLIYPLIKSIFGYPIFIFTILLFEAFAQFILDFANLAWIYEKKAASNMLVSIATLVLTSVLSIALIMMWNGDHDTLYYGRVIGTALPQVAIAIFVWAYIFKQQPYGFNKEYWKYSFLFGVPLVFHMLSQQILGQSDRLMMKWFGTGSGQIGIYSFYYSFVTILTTILNALNNSWCPFLYDDLAKRNYKVLDKKIGNYVQIFTVLCLGFLLVSREVMKIFANEEYWSGVNLIPILVLVTYCTYFYQFGVNYEFFNSRPRVVAIGTVVAAISNIILNSILIPPYGMFGAAIATLISYAILAAMHTIVVKTWKLEKYPLTYKPVVLGLLLVLIGCVVFYVAKDLMVIRWGLGVALGVYLVLSVYKRKTIF